MNVAILGHGSIGYRHYSNVEAAGHAVDYYDPQVIGRSSPDYREILINSADAVIICSPSKDHEKDIVDCLAAGRHILCEKPFGYHSPDRLASTVVEARTLVTNPPIIATGFNLRFHSCVIEAKKLIPEIGDIQFASFTVLQKTERPVYLRDGILRNWCSHEFDLANHLLGPGGKVVNCLSEGDGEDTLGAIVTMKYPSVASHVFVQADYYSDPERRHFFIEGTKGGIYVNLVSRTIFRKQGEKRWLSFQGTDSFDENYIDEMKSFIRSVETGVHQQPLATGEDGVAALYQVMEARQKAGLK